MASSPTTTTTRTDSAGVGGIWEKDEVSPLSCDLASGHDNEEGESDHHHHHHHPVVEEVPAEVENQVMESSVLLSARGKDLSPSDVEAGLPTCGIEDPPIEESLDSEESDAEDEVSLDGSIARELEDLMLNLRKASSVEYRLTSSNRVLSDIAGHPSFLMYEDLPTDFEPELAQQH